MTYCYLGNSTKCSSPTPPHLSLSLFLSPPPIFPASFLAQLGPLRHPSAILLLFRFLFFSFFFSPVQPFLFPFLFDALSVPRPGRQSAARYGRGCKHLGEKITRAFSRMHARHNPFVRSTNSTTRASRLRTMPRREHVSPNFRVPRKRLDLPSSISISRAFSRLNTST